jgi:mono/diheme cytochrome c family protein
MRTLVPALVLSGAALLSACGGSNEAMPTPASESPRFSEQAARGARLFVENCAKCHGPAGEGAKAPRLVGLDDGALPLHPRPEQKIRMTPFRTAADVAAFVVKNMPPGGPSLPIADYWAILAFDLQANGVTLEAPLGPSNAGSVHLHD